MVKAIIHPLLDGDEDVVEGYRSATEHELGTMKHAASLHPELVERWQRLLTLHHRAVRGTYTFPGDPEDEDGVLAFKLRTRLLAMAGGTSKLALDATLFGYYSGAFGLIRHLLESWIQAAYVGFRPEVARPWFGQQARDVRNPKDLYEQKVAAAISYLESRFDRDYPQEKYLIDRTKEIRKAMHKGAHPSGHLLDQMTGPVEGNSIVGPNYRPTLAEVALSDGVWATLLILCELNNLIPQSSEWQLALSAIKNVHRPAVPDFTDAAWPDADGEG